VAAVALLLVLATTALAASFSLRFPSLTSTLLAAYVVALAEVMSLTLVLSPFQAVTRTGLAAGEAVVLTGVLAVWWRAGRPVVTARGVPVLLRDLGREPIVLALGTIVGAALVYELVLVLVAPPNNWDSLTYHLARAAAWAQHGGVYWIPNAPTARMNEFQPGAEQLVLYLFVVTGGGALSALPQYLAELAATVGVYVAARRLGFAPRQAIPAALLFPTLSLVALESTTGQNDLVAAALAVAAAALLLGRSAREDALAGIGIGMAIGVKLTIVIAIPVLLALAAGRGWRAARRFAAATILTFAVLGMWGYVLNAVETGHVLGHGEGRVENTAHPSFPGSISTAYRMLYRLVDLSGLSTWMIWALAIAGAVAGAGALAARRTSLGGWRQRVVLATTVVAPFLLPLLALVLADAMHGVASIVHLPIDGSASTSAPFSWHVNRVPNEDFSAFGPLGIALFAGSLWVSWVAWRRRSAGGSLALGLALPLFVVVLALSSKYNPWLSRFLLVPTALALPLTAAWFRRRELAVGVVVVASVALVMAHVRNQLKPIEGAVIEPWAASQVQAVDRPWLAGVASGISELNLLVPASGCLGALVDSDDPTFLLYGPRLDRKLVFLTGGDEQRQADAAGLSAIVVKATDFQDPQKRFTANGWQLTNLSTYFTLARRPSRSGAAHCARLYLAERRRTRDPLPRTPLLRT